MHKKWKKSKNHWLLRKKVEKVAGVTGLEPASSGVAGQRLMAVFSDSFDIFTDIYRRFPKMTYMKS
tara:strand:- start:6052 stop:6249 length:198 start_codon:yes stop_codon:yes gene_type:complete